MVVNIKQLLEPPHHYAFEPLLDAIQNRSINDILHLDDLPVDESVQHSVATLLNVITPSQFHQDSSVLGHPVNLLFERIETDLRFVILNRWVEILTRLSIEFWTSDSTRRSA